MRKLPVLPKKLAGYTVLELLVVIAIIGILMGVGYANYRGYAQNQTVVASSRALRADLRLAQEEATAGRKPVGCIGYLIGYKFTVLTATTYKIEANCSGGDILIKNVTVDSSVTVSTPIPNPIIFKSLAQGTNLTSGGFAVVGITQQTTNNYASVLIAAAGNIEESFITPPPAVTPAPSPSPTPAGFTAYQPDSNTIAFWHMNETAGVTLADSSSANISAVSAAAIVTGKLGNARSFSGQYIRNTSALAVNTTGPNTVDFWMKWTGVGSNMMVFTWDSFLNFDLYNASCLGFNTGNAEIYGTTTTTPANQWVYVALVYSRTGPTANKIYINGVNQSLRYCLGSTSGALTVTPNLWAGSYGGGWPFNGTIDELRVSNIERTATEIQGAYQYGLTNN